MIRVRGWKEVSSAPRIALERTGGACLAKQQWRSSARWHGVIGLAPEARSPCTPVRLDTPGVGAYARVLLSGSKAKTEDERERGSDGFFNALRKPPSEGRPMRRQTGRNKSFGPDALCVVAANEPEKAGQLRVGDDCG